MIKWRVAFLLYSSVLLAQTETSLSQAVEAALARYPSVRVSQEQMQSAAAGIALARTAYLPRADVLAQLNRATRNNVFGLLLPQSTLPTISGPPNPENDLTSVWGSAVGFLVTWEPFDFGLRRANVEAAEAARARADAALARTRFEVGAATADAYLTLLAAEQTVRSAMAQRDRSKTIDTVVSALVEADLRPGADLSRSRAEIAAAETQVIRAEEAVRLAQITLQQFTGSPLVPVRARFAEPLKRIEAETAATNPYLREQQTVIDEARARQQALDRSWYPRFLLQGSSYARGTGANPDGTTGGAVAGIGPNIQNWAVGMTVTFPALELPSLKARKEVERHRHEAEVARFAQLRLDVDSRIARASATFEASRRIAEQTPLQCESARAAERQARARYEAGLATLAEVADAQRLLTQAEIDDSLARLSVWRATLGIAVARGDLTPFLELTK